MGAPWRTAVKDWSSGPMTSTDLDAQLRDFANAFGPLTPYTPSISSSSGSPSVGNGSLVGRYTAIQNMGFVRVALTMGSTTSLGTAGTAISLPFNVEGSFDGVIEAFGFSGTNYYRGIGRCSGNTITRTLLTDGVSGPNGFAGTTRVLGVTSGPSPTATDLTWGTGAQFIWQGWVELA